MEMHLCHGRNIDALNGQHFVVGRHLGASVSCSARCGESLDKRRISRGESDGRVLIGLGSNSASAGIITFSSSSPSVLYQGNFKEDQYRRGKKAYPVIGPEAWEKEER